MAAILWTGFTSVWLEPPQQDGLDGHADQAVLHVDLPWVGHQAFVRAQAAGHAVAVAEGPAEENARAATFPRRIHVSM